MIARRKDLLSLILVESLHWKKKRIDCKVSFPIAEPNLRDVLTSSEMSNVKCIFEQSTRTLMSAIFLRKFVIIGWIFVAFMGQYGNVLSQNDSASSMKVIPLNSLVKYSTVMLRNNYLVPGKVFAVQKGEEFLLPVELGLNDTIEVETRDYDKLIFKFEVPMYDGTFLFQLLLNLK
ncbi:MAG: hypothetical protein IPG99_04250 [Ignavibacteria bacterium]|nr:hypothetical protein [Ignavibacteria bacterium]